MKESNFTVNIILYLHIGYTSNSEDPIKKCIFKLKKRLGITICNFFIYCKNTYLKIGQSTILRQGKNSLYNRIVLKWAWQRRRNF